MEFLFMPLCPAKKEVAKYYTIVNLCSQGTSIEELILAWVAPGHSLIISYNPAMPYPALGVHFARGSRTKSIAVATVPVERVYVFYPKIKKFDPSKVLKRNPNRKWLNKRWFKRRNERLFVTSEPELPGLIAPPTAVSELILSYALSKNGLAIIEWNEEQAIYNYPQLFTLTLTCLQNQKEGGWEEIFLVKRSDFERYVKSRNENNESDPIH